MSNKVNIEVSVPFDFCESCGDFEISEMQLYTEGQAPPVWIERSCKHAGFCERIIKRYERARKAETAAAQAGDSWYKENFTESDAYKKKDLIDRKRLIESLEARIELEEQKPMTGLKTVPLLKQTIETIKKMRSENGEDKA